MELNCLYKIEISPKKIFHKMKKNIYNNFSNYSFLSISNEYLSLRKEVFSLIKKISYKMGFKSQTFFLSVYYLDILFSQSKKIDCNLNIMGLACLLLSAKYCENDPAVPELKHFIRIYNRIVGSKNSISVSDLFYSEVITCKMLNHKLNYYTVYDFNSFFFSHNILKPEQICEIEIKISNNHNNDENADILTLKSRIILEKIYKKSRYYLDNLLESSLCLKYDSLLLSIYIMKKSIENTLLTEQNLDKHNLTLKDKFLKKTNNYFKNLMNEYYNIDYENIPEFHKLTEEYDFINIFKQEKKRNEDFSPINNQEKIRHNNTLTSINKTPNKVNDIKSFLHRVTEINFSSSKKNFYKSKCSNSLQSKMNNNNCSLQTSSGINMPRLSFNQSKNVDLNQKTLYRNLEVINCNENNKRQENDILYSDRKNNNNNSEVNKLMFLYRLNSQNNINNKMKISNDKNNEYFYSTSPFKFGNSEIILNYNNQNIQKKQIFKKAKTKTTNFKKINIYSNDLMIKNKSVEKNKISPNKNNDDNISVNANINMNKPYYKKVVQNCGIKLKNFNKISNKIIQNNNDNINTNEQTQENKPLYNIVNRMPKYKLNNYLNNKEKEKEEFKSDTKLKVNNNNSAKKYNLSINKDINISNLKKDYKEKTEYNSNNKEKKIRKLLHINLNPKLSDYNISPMNSLNAIKKNSEEIFSTATYSNNSNSKNRKFDTKTVKPTNIFASSIDNRNNNIRANQKMNFLLARKSLGLNIRLKDIKIKLNNNNNYSYKNYNTKENNNEKKKEKDNKNNYLYESNDNAENNFSNTLTSSHLIGRFSFVNLRRDNNKNKEKDKNNINNNNKIILTDYTISGDEQMNNIDGDMNDYIDYGKHFNTNTFKKQVFEKSKRIIVKKNNYENEYITDKDDEKHKNKKIINQNMKRFKASSNKSNDFRNFEESNEEDSNSINQKKYLLYSMKNNKLDDDNNISNQIKKNPSTIVINNNININFGNKLSNITLKDNKKNYKNLIKNTQIQINNNNGQNSIASLLNKIPLCYKNSEPNINVRKKNIINYNNKK